MDSIKKVTISWSGGKDAAFALYKIVKSGKYEVVHLHTVVDEDTRRVGMHGVREELIYQQAQYIGLPLRIVYLKKSEGDNNYTKLMTAFYQDCAKQGIEGVVFGDIYLEDLRTYRETLLASSGLEALFPLWNEDTKTVVTDFLKLGFRALLCSANSEFFSEAEVGQTLDSNFSNAISPLVDPCGERGEFHTFVYDSALFTKPIKIQKGKVEQKSYAFNKQNEDGSVQRIESKFWFQELLPTTDHNVSL